MGTVNGRFVGVDLGGTSIRASMATGPVSHGEHVELRTPAADGPEAVLDACAGAVREATGGATPDGVAIGIPGPLDAGRGIVFAAPQLAGWENVNALEILTEKCGGPVAIQNDANLAGYAEWRAGAGRGAQHMIFVTISSGVGGAIIVNGELITGFAGTAGEVGHFPLGAEAAPCGEGHRGCLEGTASGTAMARHAQKALDSGRASSLRDQLGELDARAIEDSALAGDALATQLYDDVGRAVGRAMGGLINLLSPEIIVVGGGLANAGDLLFTPLDAGVGEVAFERPRSACRIVKAHLGTDAGLVGAVVWAVEAFGPTD